MTEEQFDEDRLVSEVYGLIKTDNPPSDADREVLARAHEMKTSSSLAPFAGNWKVPLSLAAVFVVALAVVLKLGVGPQETAPMQDQVLQKKSVPAPAVSSQPESRERAASPAARAPLESDAAESELLSPGGMSLEARDVMVEESAKRTDKEIERTGRQNYGSMDDFMSPEFWQEEILSLYTRGHIDVARKEFRVFKEAFPDFDASELEQLLAN